MTSVHQRKVNLERLYRIKSDPEIIYVIDTETMEIPDDATELVRTYHVLPCTKVESDYKVKFQGQTFYFKFATESGKLAWAKAIKTGINISKSSYVPSVTNPECLEALGKGDKVVELELID